MADPAQAVLLAPESDTLTPLPGVLRSGLKAVAVLAAISFISSALVFSYLTFKLVRWHFRSTNGAGSGEPQTVDLALGLAERHFGGGDSRLERRSTDRRKRGSPNQFLVLVYNLLLSDMHQASSFLLSASWLTADSIQVGTATCAAQAWLVSTGDLASGGFISAIAVHTYLIVVWGYKPPQWALYLAIVVIWVFVYIISAAGIIATKNGRSAGGFYVRAGAWCWVNIEYETIRLLTHYLFIFISLAITTILYTLVFISLRRSQKHPPSRRPAAQPPPAQPPLRSKSLGSKTSVDLSVAARSVGANPPASGDSALAHSGGYHPVFLIYPVIYFVCTAPLAFGRIATMTGAKIPVGYFCAAGALITSNGWLDVLLWGITRRSLLFSAEIDTEDSGLSTFAFMRTPHERKYGNMVWVEGAGGRDGAAADEPKDRWTLGWARKWMGWRRLGFGGGDHRRRSRNRSGTLGLARRRSDTHGSQQSLRGPAGISDMAIQMDMVTTVVVEVDNGRQKQTTPYGETSTYSMSMNDSDKEVHQRV